MLLNHREVVLLDVDIERDRQDAKWGEQNHPNGTGSEADQTLATLSRSTTDRHAREGVLTFRDILKEEFYEALAESDPQRLREELIQVAAVAVAWVEKIDRDAAKAEAA